MKHLIKIRQFSAQVANFNEAQFVLVIINHHYKVVIVFVFTGKDDFILLICQAFYLFFFIGKKLTPQTVGKLNALIALFFFLFFIFEGLLVTIRAKIGKHWVTDQDVRLDN